jgi:HEXXH motif-containing protein
MIRRDQTTSLRRAFMPGDPALTATLVAKSGLRRLEEFTKLTVYLGSLTDFTEDAPLLLDTLQVLQAESPAVLDRRLASPIFRGWLSRFGRVSFTKDDPLLARQISCWNNMIHSLAGIGADFDTVFAVVNGRCATWDARVVLCVGDHSAIRITHQNGTYVAWSMGDTATMLLRWTARLDGTIEVIHRADGCDVTLALRLPESEIVLRNDVPFLQLKLSDTAERDTGVVFATFDHSAEGYPQFDVEEFLAAATLMLELWPEEYREFETTLQVVVPRGVPPRWRARGMTVSSHQGAIWILARGLVNLVEHITHEQSHVKLRYIEETWPLLTPEQTAERFKVGWRRDLRPIVGIYEGVYVHLHCAVMLARLAESKLCSAAERNVAAARLADIIADVREGIAILASHASFTPGGDVYLKWAVDTLGEIGAAPTKPRTTSKRMRLRRGPPVATSKR